MRVDIIMQSTFKEREREVLRCMYNGIKDDLWPDDADYNAIRAINKRNGRLSGVNLSYDERAKGKYNLAVIFGSWKKRENDHHKVRTGIANRDNPFLCIETQLLGRKMFQEGEYHRVGINGFLNEAAVFGPEQTYPDDRFNKLDMTYKGWNRKRGDKIIMALQLPGDASLRGADINEWAIWSLNEMRQVTDRPIEIRTHPGLSQKGIDAHLSLYQHISFNKLDATFVNGKDIPWEEHITDAHCVLAYTSGLSIDAVRSGVPVVCGDPGNFTWSLSSKHPRQVEDPFLADEGNVKQWLDTLAYCQWSKEEMTSGECWAHLKPCVEQLLEDESAAKESN